MPIFDYKCRQCSAEFEAIVLGANRAACPSCESQDLEQQLSAFAVSSDGIRRANAADSRRRQMTSSTLRDQKVAEAEYVKEHND